MKRVFGFALLLGSVLGAIPCVQAKPSPPARGPRLEAVTLLVRHRVFHDFQDVQRVKLNQDFILGDTEFSGRVIQYVPDFEMDLNTRKVFSRTTQPNNPAFKVVVRKSKVPQDTSWAFLNMPPHFARRSFFAFQVLRIDFADHSPLHADTSSAAPAAPAGSPARANPTPKDSAGHR